MSIIEITDYMTAHSYLAGQVWELCACTVLDIFSNAEFNVVKYLNKICTFEARL